jgi:hypothetical protein
MGFLIHFFQPSNFFGSLIGPKRVTGGSIYNTFVSFNLENLLAK